MFWRKVERGRRGERREIGGTSENSGVGEGGGERER